MRRLLPVLLAIGAIVVSPSSPASAQDLKPVRGVIHLDTSVSGGEYEPEELVRFLIDNDVEVGIFTDQATVEWGYGFFPARWIMGWATGWAIGVAFGRTGSVDSFGAGNYVHLFDELDKQYKDITVIPGVEAIPFFYWSGSLLGGDLTLHNGYKHLLVTGLSAEDLASLPSVGAGTFRGYGIQSILSLWPLLPLVFGIRFIRREGTGRVYGGILAGIGVLFLLHNFPFRFGAFDQYNGDQGAAPYQAFLDYVAERNGISIWAHPEIAADRTFQKGVLEARIITEPYHNALLQNNNYTGFAAFAEGMKHIIPPGGIWDKVLLEYTKGYRSQPVWAIAEGDVEGDSFSPRLSQTVFWVKERTREALLDAIREGRIHAVAGPLADGLHLTVYAVEAGATRAVSGQTLGATSGEVRLRAKVVCDDSPNGNALKIDIIMDGTVVKSLRGEGSIDIDYGLPANDQRTHYVRLDVRAPKQSRLLTNPIFFRFSDSGSEDG
jgi:hypothetical protein